MEAGYPLPPSRGPQEAYSPPRVQFSLPNVQPAPMTNYSINASPPKSFWANQPDLPKLDKPSIQYLPPVGQTSPYLPSSVGGLTLPSVNLPALPSVGGLTLPSIGLDRTVGGLTLPSVNQPALPSIGVDRTVFPTLDGLPSRPKVNLNTQLLRSLQVQPLPISKDPIYSHPDRDLDDQIFDLFKERYPELYEELRNEILDEL